MPLIGINDLVRRQTADSNFSHYAGTFEELVTLVERCFKERGNVRLSYRNGVQFVKVPVEGFFSGVVEITPETELRAVFTARTTGEAPYVQVLAKAPKTPAKYVEVAIYRHGVLQETNDATDKAFVPCIVCDEIGRIPQHDGHWREPAQATCDECGGKKQVPRTPWEIVSIHARVTDEPEPPTPMEMARDFLGLPGRTKAQYTAEDFAVAIEYWSKRVPVG